MCGEVLHKQTLQVWHLALQASLIVFLYIGPDRKLQNVLSKSPNKKLFLFLDKLFITV